MATAGERLRQLAGFSGSAAALLLAIGTGATAGDLLASRSGVGTGTAAAHLLADNLPQGPVVGTGANVFGVDSAASGVVTVAGVAANTTSIGAGASGTVAVSGTGANEVITSPVAVGTLLVTGGGTAGAEVSSFGLGHAAFLATGANTIAVTSAANGTVITPRATPQQVRAGCAVLTGGADLTAQTGRREVFAGRFTPAVFALRADAPLVATVEENAATEAAGSSGAVATKTAKDAVTTVFTAAFSAQTSHAERAVLRQSAPLLANAKSTEITVLVRRTQ